MENKKLLFRQDVIDNRLHRRLGTVRINIPINFKIAGMVAIGIIFMLSVFFCFAQISERTFVRGYLDTENGIISVESDVPGIIEQIFVEEGSKVKKGQLLFIILNSSSMSSDIQIKNYEQRITNLKREYQIKMEHYQALSKLYIKQYISALNLHDTESERELSAGQR